MVKYITDRLGNRYEIDFFCFIDKSNANKNRDGTTFVEIKNMWSTEIKELSVYFRHERTWDDHMGNTPSGYYCIIPLLNGERKRVYIQEKRQFFGIQV